MKLFFEIFGFKIPAYGLFAAIGLLGILHFLKTQKIYKKLDFDTAMSGLIYAVVPGAVLAKVLFWITDPRSFTILFDSKFNFIDRLRYSFSGGMVYLGGFIGAGIGVWYFIKKYKLEPLKSLDVFAISMPILQMFGRMGCFFAGCCYGRPTDSFLGVVFPQGGLAPAGIKLFPTQLFGALGNFLIVLVLLIYSSRSKKPGSTLGLYLIMYSIGRFIIEFFRGDEIRGIYFGLSTSQWISIPLLIVGIGLTIYSYKKYNDKKDKIDEENFSNR